MKLLKELIFVQDTGVYNDEILVVAGITDKTKVLSFLKRYKADKKFSEWIAQDFDIWIEGIKKENKASFCFNKDANGIVLILCSPKDTWDYWETLMHEVHHAVFNLSVRKSLIEEMEAQAYLMEYLFRSIRRKLQGVDKI